MHRYNLDPSTLDMLVHIKANLNKLLQDTDAGRGRASSVSESRMKELEEYVIHRDAQIRGDPTKLDKIPGNTTFWMD